MLLKQQSQEKVSLITSKPSLHLSDSHTYKRLARVGKTSLTVRYCKNQFDDKQPSTLDASCLEKQVDVNGLGIKLVIWDTAGQERYHALNPVYYRGAEGKKSGIRNKE